MTTNNHNPETTRARLEAILRDSFSPVYLEVVDHSHQHVGHAGAREGGHFEVLIVSDRFSGLSRLEAQRLVHSALEQELRSSIHALALRVLTPERWRPSARGESH